MTGDEKLDILIVDDEPLARRRIEALCGRMDNISRIDSASGGQEALDIIAQNCPDIVLLDIDMPDMTGMAVAQQCRKMGQNPHQHSVKTPEIVFTTAHSRYAVEAFRIDAADYLLKPVKEDLLKEAFERILRKRQPDKAGKQIGADHWLWVQGGDAMVQIRSADVGWIVAERDYMRLCLPDRSYLVHEAMQSLLERLPEGMFIRIHRSAAVRRDLLSDIRRKGRRSYAVMEGGLELTIGPSYLETVLRMSGR